MSKTVKYKLPPISLFESDVQEYEPDWYDDEEKGELIVNTINRHGFKSEVKAIHHGCSFTRYELSLEGKKKISSVLNLADNLAMVLEVENVRMLVPVPGKNTIGVEVPNKERTVVRFGSLLDALGAEMEMRIPIALGKDVYRQPMLFDLATSPHLLVGGMNGDEKTAFLDSLICSLLCTKTPDEVRLLDNRNAILFIRGERPVLDLKYDIMKHPNVELTADGKGEPFVHGDISDATRSVEVMGMGVMSDEREEDTPVEGRFELLTEKEIENEIKRMEGEKNNDKVE